MDWIFNGNTIAVVVAVLAFFGVRNVIFKFLANRAHQRFEAAKSKNESLKTEVAELEKELAKIEGREEKLENKIQNTNENTVSENWHEGWKK